MDIISQYLFKLDDKYDIISNIDYGYLLNYYHFDYLFHYNYDFFMKIFSFYHLDIKKKKGNYFLLLNTKYK